MPQFPVKQPVDSGFAHIATFQPIPRLDLRLTALVHLVRYIIVLFFSTVFVYISRPNLYFSRILLLYRGLCACMVVHGTEVPNPASGAEETRLSI